MLEKIQFRTKKDGVTSLTEQINAFVEKSGVQSGLLCAFITHTTAGLTVNSFWDPLGHEDIQDEIRRLIPEQLGMSYHVGVTACMDSDFVGNGRPSVGGYLQPDNINKLGTYNRAGVLNTDRESSIIMTMCNLFERRGGAVFNVTDNLISGEKFREGAGTETSIDLALEGIAVLHQMEMKKAQAGKENWFPGLEQMN